MATKKFNMAPRLKAGLNAAKRAPMELGKEMGKQLGNVSDLAEEGVKILGNTRRANKASADLGMKLRKPLSMEQQGHKVAMDAKKAGIGKKFGGLGSMAGTLARPGVPKDVDDIATALMKIEDGKKADNMLNVTLEAFEKLGRAKAENVLEILEDQNYHGLVRMITDEFGRSLSRLGK